MVLFPFIRYSIIYLNVCAKGRYGFKITFFLGNDGQTQQEGFGSIFSYNKVLNGPFLARAWLIK